MATSESETGPESLFNEWYYKELPGCPVDPTKSIKKLAEILQTVLLSSDSIVFLVLDGMDELRDRQCLFSQLSTFLVARLQIFLSLRYPR